MLFLVTNRTLVPEDSYITVIKEAIEGGVDGIILREKDLATEELLNVATPIKALIGDKNIMLSINGNLSVAKEINAPYFHTSFQDFMNSEIDFKGKIGVSIHSKEEAVLAKNKGANYLLAGHVFETDCKKGVVPRGVNWLKEIRNSVNIPVIAIGGINIDNVKEILEVGAAGIAVMSEIMASKNPKVKTMEFKNIIEPYKLNKF